MQQKTKIILSGILVLLVASLVCIFVFTKQPTVSQESAKSKYNDALSPYSTFGLKYNFTEDRVVMDNREVRYFKDEKRRIQYYSQNGEIDLVVLYEGDELKGIEIANEEEFTKNSEIIKAQYNDFNNIPRIISDGIPMVRF